MRTSIKICNFIVIILLNGIELTKCANVTKNSDFGRIVARYDSLNITDPSSEACFRVTKADYYEWAYKKIDRVMLFQCLCAANINGNYQFPHNCNQFIMCDNGAVWLWECPKSESYNPFLDDCVAPGNQCPYNHVWSGNPSCEKVAERPWWSPLTFPENPEVRCGSKIRYCKNFQKTGNGECLEGFRYSKAYNACLPEWMCLRVDTYYGF